MDQKRMPLCERLEAHRKNKPISFHVPGHKNGLLYEGFSILQANAAYDVTELTGLDDLHDPHEAIAEAQELLTSFYHTEKSYFLVNGSTVGNLAMILATCEEGDIVLVQRNCHKSILNGLRMANVRPVFISPEMNEELMIPGRIKMEDIYEAINKYDNIKACIFTYPDYYGQVYEIEEMIKVLHSYNIIVLVDEAHGAHFSLGDPFPESALTLGADITVQSAHKTLPAMTMGSYLHINSDRIARERVEFYLSVLQSSSPSYPIMASLDYARYYIANFTKQDIRYTLEQREVWIEQFQKSGMIVKCSHDPLKIIVRHPHYSGFQLQEKLESTGVYSELADPFQVLCILPLLKEGMAYPNIQFPEFTKADSNKNVGFVNMNHPITELSISYKDMNTLPVEWIKSNEAIGEIAAKMIIPYPPGIPLLLPGERITINHVRQLHLLLESGARFQGEVEQIKSGNIAIFTNLENR